MHRSSGMKQAAFCTSVLMVLRGEKGGTQAGHQYLSRNEEKSLENNQSGQPGSRAYFKVIHRYNLMVEMVAAASSQSEKASTHSFD